MNYRNVVVFAILVGRHTENLEIRVSNRLRAFVFPPIRTAVKAVDTKQQH